MAINAAYLAIIQASPENRRDLFLRSSQRLGTTLQNIEKDFWVCWTLDALFNGLPSGKPRLLFKGGTSLSKAYGLISRFSEDIDVTVFRGDLGRNVAVEELERLSGKKRKALLDAIKYSCREFILGDLQRDLNRIIAAFSAERYGSARQVRITVDDADLDGQTLLLSYPTVAEHDGDYIRSSVKIESGAKSALDPHRAAVITPYVAADAPDLKLDVPNVTTIHAERTFWDKVVILHGQHSWFVRRGTMRREGHRRWAACD
ncbi:MAG: nucleotidyl transferase AbiEii/AbiGii toxin family protein [Gemmatimonadaceae bacterium]